MGVERGYMTSKPQGRPFGTYDEDDRDVWGPLAELPKQWTAPGVTLEEKEKLTQLLFRRALGHEDEMWYYSFCDAFQGWQTTHQRRHCDLGRCDECVDWREWHCSMYISVV